MATTTPNRGYPYPNLGTDPNDIPGDLQALAEAIDADVCTLLNGVVGRPVARIRGTGTFQSLSAAGIVGQPQVNRVPFDTVDFDPFGLLELGDQTINNRMVRVTQPGFYMAIMTIQVPTFTTAGVTVNYNRWQMRRGNVTTPSVVAGVRISADSHNIPTNNDDANVRLMSAAGGAFFDGITDAYSCEFMAITTPTTPEYPVNERTLTVLRMTES